MSDLLGKLRRAAGKSPPYVVRRVVRDARAEADRWRAPRRDRSLTPDRLCRELGAPTIDALWERCAARPWPFPSTRDDLGDLDRLCPEHRAAVLEAADRALQRRVDLVGSGEVELVGSGEVELGPRIDWLTDVRSGRSWPPAFSRGIDYANLDAPSDIKFPWELSRLQWALPLGQAWLITGEDRYAEGARDLIDAWIEGNPYAWTVNWSCTMEPAIRILTWTWFFFTLHDSPAFADPDFRFRFLKNLLLHGEYTERHFERSDLNGNHFVADAAGLVFAGLCLGPGNAPDRWADRGLADLEAELPLQVTADGVDFEGSVPYHRLVTELFVLPAMYAEAHGRPVSAGWRDRTAAMAEFVAAYSGPDGGSPLWGDADDGRALPLGSGRRDDHRYLIAWAAQWLDRPALLDRFGGPVDEVLWILGAARTEAAAGRTTPPGESREFPHGGYRVLAHGADQVFVDCGPVGMAGVGGHGHNDVLSFEAVLDGVRLVSDRGCFVYTGSPRERNEFRSTAAHNTPSVDGEEINRLVRRDWLWALHDDTRPEVRSWSVTPTTTSLEVSHDGYQRLASPVTVVRRFELDGGEHRLTIRDSLEGAGHHAIEVPLHLAPGVEVDRGASDLRLRAGGRSFELTWEGTEGWELSEEASRVSPSYGVAVPTRRLAWCRTGAMPAVLEVRLSACPEGG